MNGVEEEKRGGETVFCSLEEGLTTISHAMSGLMIRSKSAVRDGTVMSQFRARSAPSQLGMMAGKKGHRRVLSVLPRPDPVSKMCTPPPSTFPRSEIVQRSFGCGRQFWRVAV